jgi:hypothetical protein
MKRPENAVVLYSLAAQFPEAPWKATENKKKKKSINPQNRNA